MTPSQCLVIPLSSLVCVHACMCMHTHIHTRAHVHTATATATRTHVRTCRHKHAWTCMHACPQALMPTRINACMCALTNTPRNWHVLRTLVTHNDANCGVSCACICTCIRTCPHTHTHTHTSNNHEFVWAHPDPPLCCAPAMS